MRGVGDSQQRRRLLRQRTRSRSIMVLFVALPLLGASRYEYLYSQCLAFASTTPRIGSSSRSLSAKPADQEEGRDAHLIDLQSQHPKQSPSETLRSLADFCDENGIHSFDVYGDFNAAPSASYLRKFEADVAKAFGKEGAVFMPSGVMAQSIALLLHSRSGRFAADTKLLSESDNRRWSFACHRTSHLLLHEQEGYSDLLDMEVAVLPLGSQPCGGPIGGSYSVEPLHLSDIQDMFAKNGEENIGDDAEDISQDMTSVIIELPHRELGGKLTPWDEVVEMGNLCRQRGVAFHCDGARIFEAAAGYELELDQVAKPFDSIYVSFYKGIGAISGAMLVGDAQFCSEARTWLRRFGGNLFTLLPYAVSGWEGYQKRYIDDVGPTFAQKTDKMRRIVKLLSEHTDISDIVTFDPKVPQTNMVHGFLRSSLEDCQGAVDEIAENIGVKVLSRVRAVAEAEDEATLGFGTRFEWSIGDANFGIEDHLFIKAWRAFALNLIARQGGQIWEKTKQ